MFLQRHNLEFISIFNEEGKVCNSDTRFDGMKRFDARVAVTEALMEMDLFVEKKENPMVVPRCRFVAAVAF